MSKEEIDIIAEKLMFLKKQNPLKFERFKGRLEALYENEIENDSKGTIKSV